MDRILAQNDVVPFVGTYQAIGENSTEMAINPEGRPNGTYPFGVFHTSLGST